MATWGELKTEVAAILGRGATQDTSIANALRQAGMWMERNYSFSYMNRYVTFTLDASAAEPRVLPIPARMKKIDFIRLGLASGQFHTLSRISPGDVTAHLTGLPRGYWLDSNEGTGYLWLDNTVDQNYSGEMSYVQYTDWANLADSAEPWPLIYAEDFLKWQALLYIGPKVRLADPTWAKFKLLRDEALQTLLTAEWETAHGGARLESLEFIPTNFGSNQYPTAT